MNRESQASIEEILEELEKSSFISIFGDDDFRNKFKGFLRYMNEKGAETIEDAYNMLKNGKIKPDVVSLWIEEGFLEGSEIKNEILIDGIANGYPQLKNMLKEQGHNYLSDDEKNEIFRQITSAYDHIKSLEKGRIESIEEHLTSIKEYMSGFCDLLRVSEEQMAAINGPYNHLLKEGYETLDEAYSALRKGSIDENIVSIWLEERVTEHISKMDGGRLDQVIREGYPDLFRDKSDENY